MRTLVLAAALVTALAANPHRAHAAVTEVQSASAVSATAVTSLSAPITTTAGDTEVVLVTLRAGGAHVLSVTDSAGTSYVFQAGASNSTSARAELWATAAGGSHAATSITATFSASTKAALAVDEFSGATSVYGGSTNTGSSFCGPNGVGCPNAQVTSTTAGDIIAGGFAWQDTLAKVAPSNCSSIRWFERQDGGTSGGAATSNVAFWLQDNVTDFAATYNFCVGDGATIPWVAAGLALH